MRKLRLGYDGSWMPLLRQGEDAQEKKLGSELCWLDSQDLRCTHLCSWGESVNAGFGFAGQSLHSPVMKANHIHCDIASTRVSTANNYTLRSAPDDDKS